jgi:hypothetical protein
MSTLDGVLPGPLPGGGLVASAVGLVDMCDLGDKRVVGVGVCEHGADGEEHCVCVSMLIAWSITVSKIERRGMAVKIDTEEGYAYPLRW